MSLIPTIKFCLFVKVVRVFFFVFFLNYYNFPLQMQRSYVAPTYKQTLPPLQKDVHPRRGWRPKSGRFIKVPKTEKLSLSTEKLSISTVKAGPSVRFQN